MSGLSRLLLGLWFGGGAILLAVATPAAFRHAGDHAHAAEAVGAMLRPWHWLAIIAPLIALLIPSATARRSARISVLALGMLFAVAQTVIDARIHAIRQGSAIPISSLSRTDPVRRRFGTLHGFSSVLMLLEVAAAGTALWIEE
jgi:Domain of unknown function (DUF4149)